MSCNVQNLRVKSSADYRREAVTVDLNGYVVNDSGIKGIRNAMAPLMRIKADLENGKLKREQVPDYVFDILEFEDYRHFPANGEKGKVYIDDDKNLMYRWTGLKYVELASPESMGYYKKPADGIPETDLAEAVQVLLGKAGTALQEHQLLHDIYKGSGENAKLKEYVLGNQADKPLVPSRILSENECPTLGEIAEALGWKEGQ